MTAPYLKIIVLALAALAGAVSGCGDNSSPTAPANRAPTSQTSIPAQTVHAGETITLDLSSYFSDPDGDALTYSATSSNAGVVSASVSGSTLAIAGLAKGTAQVTVTATDPVGLTATQTFEAAVPNRPPEPQTSIPAQTVHAGETITLDLSSYFSDPDGDALTYSATSSNAGVVSASVSGSTLAIAGLAKGTAQVTVTATDPAGLTAKQAFTAAAVPAEPDLVFTGVSPEFSTLGPGDSATFTFHIRNQGAASSGSTTIRVMRSTNPVISVRDAELSAHPFPALAPQQNHTFQVTISIDPRSAPGTIYIGPCLDPVPDESNTGNNCSGAARVTVTDTTWKR
ncbi:MAG: hypothetical protein OXK77_10210 [Gemmatimonadota bacterium]|nr:hypothetical protein [Gemmatimonadota bacterium]